MPASHQSASQPISQPQPLLRKLGQINDISSISEASERILEPRHYLPCPARALSPNTRGFLASVRLARISYRHLVWLFSPEAAMTHIFLLLVVVVAAGTAEALTRSSDCVDVVPAENFVNSMYEGRWYEIGRIQTPGGAVFQQDCWCDTTDFHSDTPLVGDGRATYSCRKHGPDGKVQSATADLFHDGVPGKFKQQFPYFLAPKLDYTVVYVDEGVAMEYDCGTTLGLTNYCVHFMARTPYMDNTTLTALMDYAESLGLNPQNIPYKATELEGCCAAPAPSDALLRLHRPDAHSARRLRPLMPYCVLSGLMRILRGLCNL
ncbi:Apolipoprotein D [Chionoecetes opilio]|uniref:Apolipoprotein D n=1 Tax=Chionoecetes opilio TaxID=41210 RepID=A0A8J4XZN9_CHIOP|nr:Apolipoprotein D [Chionoecetes opilio]